LNIKLIKRIVKTQEWQDEHPAFDIVWMIGSDEHLAILAPLYAKSRFFIQLPSVDHVGTVDIVKT